MTITLSGVQIIDLFWRFAAVGQLGLLIVFIINKNNKHIASHIALVICIISYILLTAPVENLHYGGFRNVLLLITDLTPLVALWFTMGCLNTDFKLSELPKWILTPVILWTLALAYFFLVLGGRGLFHDLNHGFGIAILLAVIYLCLAEYLDDLDNRRRNNRLMLVAFCCFYMTGLVSFEFVLHSIRDTWQFSFVNAVIIFTLVSVTCANLIFGFKPFSLTANKELIETESVNSTQLSALNALMEQDFFLEPELTIGKLSDQLDIPAHQLRELINQQLGFSNFSHFLNSYRIPWVCEQLQTTSKRSLPILTLALEAGYGSIAPFNRAFKAQMGQTPKKYRDQF